MKTYKGLEVVIDKISESLECPDCGADCPIENSEGSFYYRRKKTPYIFFKCSECDYKFLVEIED